VIWMYRLMPLSKIYNYNYNFWMHCILYRAPLKTLQNAFVRLSLTLHNIFQLIYRTARIPKYLTLWLSSHEWLFIPTINFVLNCYKTNRGSSSISRLGWLWWKWLTLLKCNHFPWIHLNVHHRCIPVVRYTWLMYSLKFLWSEVWKCYI